MRLRKTDPSAVAAPRDSEARTQGAAAAAERGAPLRAASAKAGAPIRPTATPVTTR